MTTRVLVTGSSNHLGRNLVENLLAHDYEVRAGVRGASDEREAAPLRSMGAEIIHLDIARPDMLAPAMKNVDGVFQSASVLQVSAKHSERDIVQETVEGTLNVLAAARNAGVKRIVFTSTVAAIGNRKDRPSDSPVTEDDWNEAPANPYVRAKTEAERRAWNFTRANGMEMVSINPSVILGPGFNHHTPSTETLERILREQLPVLPPFDAAYVDVRDLADLHRRAFETREANGRYIASSKFAYIEEIAKLIRQLEPTLRVPLHRIPSWMLKPAVLLHDVTTRWFGGKQPVTEDAIEAVSGAAIHCSSEKAARDLGWRPRPLEDTLADTLSWIKRTFLGA